MTPHRSLSPPPPSHPPKRSKRLPPIHTSPGDHKVPLLPHPTHTSYYVRIQMNVAQQVRRCGSITTSSPPPFPHPTTSPSQTGQKTTLNTYELGGRRATPSPVPAQTSYYVHVRGEGAPKLGASRRITTSHTPLSPPHGPRALRRTSGTLLFKETHVPHVTSPAHADCASALCATKRRRVRRGKRQGGQVGTQLVLLWRGNKQWYDLLVEPKK